MKKLLLITLFLGLTSAINAETTQTVQHAIQEAAKKNDWVAYTPSNTCDCDKQALFFKKSVKNHKYYSHRYQNRQRNKRTTVYAKVNYHGDQVHVAFVDSVSMNLGRLGNDCKLDETIKELKGAIMHELHQS